MEYRRGVTVAGWGQFWHWHPECKDYPERNFAAEKAQPPEGNLCQECKNLGRP